MLADVRPAPELREQRAVEIPFFRCIDRSQAGGADAQLGLALGARDALIVDREVLRIDEQPEPFLEAESGDLRVALLITKYLRS